MLTIIGPQSNELDIQITNQYSFITVDINDSGQSFAHIRFELTDEAGKLVSLSCQDGAIKKKLSEKIERENWPGWQSSATIETEFSDEVLQSMQTADRIAKLTKNCTHGDDYRPGNFSKIVVSDKWIELEQINYMNSKSLSHKNDYSLRKLVFTIPLESNLVNEHGPEKYQIGTMKVDFSDRSSANNRGCGDKVLAELEKITAD